MNSNPATKNFDDRVGHLIVRHRYSRAAAERQAHLEQLARVAAQQPTLEAALVVLGVTGQ